MLGKGNRHFFVRGTQTLSKSLRESFDAWELAEKSWSLELGSESQFMSTYDKAGYYINNNIVSVDIQCIHNSDKWHLTFLEVCDVWNVRTVVTILHEC